ncbi:MAG TPA: hypothetical protein VI670_27970 [Thermoanaerobaculia bacterium]|jgi:hypothetical protein
MRLRVWFLVFVGFTVIGTAHGQNAVPARVEKVATVSIQKPATLLRKWSEIYFSGDWAALQTTLRDDLKGLKFPDLSDDDQVQFERRAYSVVFITTLRKREGEIVRVVLQPSAPAPYSTTLPGLRTHYELHVKPVEAESLATTYFSTPTDDPVASQLAAFVKQFDPKALGPFFPPFALTVLTNSTFYVDLRRVRLPFARAKIDIEDDAATIADFDAKSGDLKIDAAKLTESLTVREARGIPCATDVAKALQARIESFIAQPQTSMCPTAPSDDEKKKLTTPWDVLQRELGCTYVTSVQVSTACGNAPSPEINALVVSIEGRYKDLAKAAALKVAGKTTYVNVPRSAVGLGVIAGVITSVPSGQKRYKVGNDGKLTLDPLTGGVSIAAVNIHPWRFNSATTSITTAERFRFFVGPVLTPEFGFAAGAGVGVIRGLSINAGYGVVRISTLRDGDQAGAAPADKTRPLRNSTARVVFFGLGYNFK